MPGYFESALKAISHPTRRKILKILSEGELGFTELMNKAGVRSSSLMSYHLNTLTPFIKRKSAENGRITYTLSKLGVSALRFIEMIEKSRELFEPESYRYRRLIYALKALSVVSLFSSLSLLLLLTCRNASVLSLSVYIVILIYPLIHMLFEGEYRIVERVVDALIRPKTLFNDIVENPGKAHIESVYITVFSGGVVGAMMLSNMLIASRSAWAIVMLLCLSASLMLIGVFYVIRCLYAAMLAKILGSNAQALYKKFLSTLGYTEIPNLVLTIPTLIYLSREPIEFLQQFFQLGLNLYTIIYTVQTILSFILQYYAARKAAALDPRRTLLVLIFNATLKLVSPEIRNLLLQ